MKRLLFYIMAILVMAVFTALLQQGRHKSRFTELNSSYIENSDSADHKPVVKEFK